MDVLLLEDVVKQAVESTEPFVLFGKPNCFHTPAHDYDFIFHLLHVPVERLVEDGFLLIPRIDVSDNDPVAHIKQMYGINQAKPFITNFAAVHKGSQLQITGEKVAVSGEPALHFYGIKDHPDGKETTVKREYSVTDREEIKKIVRDWEEILAAIDDEIIRINDRYRSA